MSVSITFYNLSVKLEIYDGTLKRHLDSFIDRHYSIKGQGFSQQAPVAKKEFVGKIKDQAVYMLHVNQFKHFYTYLNEIGYKLQVENKIDARDYTPVSTNFEIRPNWVLRDEQVPVVEFLLDNPKGSKLAPLATGSGKSLVSLYAIGKIRQRVGVVILPTYCPKWVQDIVSVHEATIEDVIVVQGSRALRAIIQMAKEGSLTHDYFVFSNRTIQDYIIQYDENPEFCIDFYGCAPIDLFPLLGIGVMLIDESHQHFHTTFRIITYTNVKYLIGLTATLLSDDHAVKRAHTIIYPPSSVYGDSMIKKYNDVYAISYGIGPYTQRQIKTSNYGSNNYSHTAFEISITKNESNKETYCKLINETLQDYYIRDYHKGDKALIFVSTVKFASELTDYCQKLYPMKKVNRYCQEDPYENLKESDIIISTPISAGTAVDIPNLRTVVQSVSVASSVQNVQNLGRLRKLPDRDTKFCYLYSNDVKKQKQYHLLRTELFKDRVATISYRQSRTSFK